MSEKNDEMHTQETMISHTRREELNPEETAHTVINPDQQVDMLGETVVTRIESDEPDEELLDDATMETIIDKGNPATGETRSTAMMGEEPMQAARASRKRRGSGPKYEILRSLGKGGFAWVYLVKNLKLDRLEAIKFLNSDLTEDEDVLNRFVREARTSGNFNHQNIVMVYEVEEAGDWESFEADPEIKARHKEPFAYFTMSYVEGDTATNLIKKKKRVDQKEAIRIVMDGCAALEYAHEKGVVHRDIKPENILVDRKGNGIVMDFGIAKVVDQTKQTAAGTFMGTARYVSPEQAMGREIDGRSDIYSMGVTLYELATGRVPFNSDQWMTVLYQHINEPPPAPEKFYDDIDRDLRAVILKMLSKKREERYQTAQEVYDVLAGIYHRLGGENRQTQNLDQIQTRRDIAVNQTEATEIGEATPPPVRTKIRENTTPPKEEEKSGSKMPMILGVVAVLAIAVIGFVMTRPKEPTPGPDPSPPPKTVTTDKPENVVPLTKGQLLITAFPKGEVLQLVDENGNKVSLEERQTPLLLDLPTGRYEIFVGNGDRDQSAQAIVLEGRMKKQNFVFQADDADFLLEDLR